VRLQDLVKRGDISANVEMLPGDVLIIPQGWF
jgi:polysaccharide export outer membrane protein